MLRLASKLLEKKAKHFGRGRSPIEAEAAIFIATEMRKVIGGGSPVIVADNVSEFYWSSGQIAWDLQKDFPNVAPPFSEFFIEWEIPEYGVTDTGYAKLRKHGARHFCASFRADEIVDDKAEKIIGALGIRNSGMSIYGEDFCSVIRRSKWAIACGVGATFHGQAVVQPARYIVAVGSDGQCLGTAMVANSVTTQMLLREYGIEANRVCEILHVPLLTISFMHCRNVVCRDATSEVSPTEKWMRRAGVKPVRYHVLDINPMKEVLRTEGNIGENGVKKALHICRGHFKTYTEDKPLFGHTVGTVWCPSHARGDIKHGAVVKDYRVNSR